MLGSLFVIALILVAYFYICVTPRVTLAVDKPGPPHQPFRFQIGPLRKFKLNGVEWIMPNISRFSYWWSGDKFYKIDECFRKPDDSTLPATGEAIHRWFTSGRTLREASIHQYATTTRHVDLMHSYYFKCKNGTIVDLYRCPPGTVFDNQDCAQVDLCDYKPDGYKYKHPTVKTDYFECVARQAVRRQCPTDTLFLTNSCQTPLDLCVLYEEGKIWKNDMHSYRKCVKGLTEIRYCNSNEYFLDGKCQQSECYDKFQMGSGYILGPAERTERYRYLKPLVTSYTECKDGFAVAHVRCSDHAEESDKYDLPAFQVFNDRTHQCEVPRLCRNVFPEDNFNVPSYAFRHRMNNYEFSENYDQLLAYNCNSSNQVVRQTLSPAQNVFGEDVCGKIGTKVPVMTPKFDRYVDCADNKRTKQCPPEQSFDYGRNSCWNMKNTHVFKFTVKNDHFEMPVFRISSLYKNWIPPYQQSNRFKRCTAPTIRVKHYNVCADPDCEKYAFLVQMPHLRSFMIDDEYECRVVDRVTRTIKKHRYFRQEPYKKLDFWRQKLVVDERDVLADQNCKPGTTLLETRDAVMNATIFPTCRRSIPFVFCPSPATAGLNVDNSTICLPNKSLQTVTIKAGVRMLFESYELGTATANNPNATIEVTGYLRNQTVKIDPTTLEFPPFTPSHQRNKKVHLKPSHDTTLTIKMMPTNDVRYQYRNGILLNAEWNYRDDAKYESTAQEETVLERYGFDGSLKGFD